MHLSVFAYCLMCSINCLLHDCGIEYNYSVDHNKQLSVISVYKV